MSADTVAALVLPWGEMAFGALCVAVVVDVAIQVGTALALRASERRDRAAGRKVGR